MKVYRVVLSPHLPRTKAVPSSLHACIRLAPSSQKVCAGLVSASRSPCGKEVGLLYIGFAESDVVVPALKRRKSEGEAIKGRQNPSIEQKLMGSNIPFFTVLYGNYLKNFIYICICNQEALPF